MFPRLLLAVVIAGIPATSLAQRTQKPPLHGQEWMAVTGINALGVAPAGATPDFFKSKGMDYPPAYGPLAAGKDRKQAIHAANDRSYRGDIAKELVASVRAQGDLFTEADLADWKVRIEEPVRTAYEDYGIGW